MSYDLRRLTDVCPNSRRLTEMKIERNANNQEKHCDRGNLRYDFELSEEKLDTDIEVVVLRVAVPHHGATVQAGLRLVDGQRHLKSDR